MALTVRRRRPQQHREYSRVRAGVSLVEIIVAMTLFGSVAIAMGGLSLVVARRAEANDTFTKRTAVLQQQMNRLQALPFDSLPSKAGTVLVSDQAFPHKRTITVMGTGSRTRVTIRIIPTKAPISRDSVTFDRAKPTTSPLCKGC
jgi:hypothetical protein